MLNWHTPAHSRLFVERQSVSPYREATNPLIYEVRPRQVLRLCRRKSLTCTTRPSIVQAYEYIHSNVRNIKWQAYLYPEVFLAMRFGRLENCLPFLHSDVFWWLVAAYSFLLSASRAFLGKYRLHSPCYLECYFCSQNLFLFGPLRE